MSGISNTLCDLFSRTNSCHLNLTKIINISICLTFYLDFFVVVSFFVLTAFLAVAFLAVLDVVFLVAVGFFVVSFLVAGFSFTSFLTSSFLTSSFFGTFLTSFVVSFFSTVSTGTTFTRVLRYFLPSNLEILAFENSTTPSIAA